MTVMENTNSQTETVRPIRRALFPGSFAPFTIGHLSILERGLALFDEVVVAIGFNVAKHGNDALDERVSAVREALRSFDDRRVKVVHYEGLTVDAARDHGCVCLLRGVRTVADYEYERTMADVNSRISGIETVVLFARPELAAVSSSLVRELSRYGHDVSSMLPSPQNS